MYKPSAIPRSLFNFCKHLERERNGKKNSQVLYRRPFTTTANCNKCHVCVCVKKKTVARVTNEILFTFQCRSRARARTHAPSIRRANPIAIRSVHRLIARLIATEANVCTQIIMRVHSRASHASAAFARFTLERVFPRKTIY